MKKREHISKIMTTDMITVDVEKGDLKEARNLLESNNIRHLPVVHGEELKGIISLTDIHRISFGGNFGQGEVDEAIFDMLSIEQVMSHHPKTIDANDTIKEVAELLAVEEFHAVPVTEEGKLVGIVTTTDLIKYLIEQY